MQKNFSFYKKLFFTTLQLSAFTFGGGFVIVSLMRKKFVEELHWITEQEMLDFTAIAQSAPGAIAVNASLLLGYHLAGFLGALTTIIATILPPLIILSLLSFGYTAFQENHLVQSALLGMQAGVAAVIVDIVFSMAGTFIKSKKFLSLLLMGGAFIAVAFFKVNVILILAIGALAGLLLKKENSAK